MTDCALHGLESLAEIRFRLENGDPKSRPTVYKGITFRSRLEVRFALHLDDRGLEWTYEPRVYGASGHGYLPDFQILGSHRPTFIEVKPTLEEVNAAELKMAVIWDTHPDALLIVACAEACRWFSADLGFPWYSWTERWPSRE